MTFDNLYFLIIPSVLLFLYFLFKKYLIWKERIYEQFSNSYVFGSKNSRNSIFYSKAAFVAFSFSILLLSVAIAKPKILTEQTESITKNSEMLILLDCSLSMTAADIPPNRFGIAKQLIAELLNNSKQPISLVSFTSIANLEVPPTMNYHLISSAVKRLSPNDYLPQGTNLEVALSLSANLFAAETENKIMVIISDGEFHDGNIIKSLKTLSDNNIFPIFISIGTSQGGEIQVGNIKEITKANHKDIKEAAKRANGLHFLISNPQELTNISIISDDIFRRANVKVKEEFRSFTSLLILIAFFSLLFFWKL